MKIKNLFYTSFIFIAAIPVSCNSSKTKLTIPTASKTTYEYTNKETTLELENYDSSTCSISGNKATEVGEYTATISIKDTSKYVWSNNTSNDISISWSIINVSNINTPTKINSELLYTGNEVTFLPDNYESIKDYCSISDNKAKEIGNYTAKLSLIDPVKTKWDDNTIEDKTISWSIASSVKLTKPTEDTLQHYYTGKGISYSPVNYDEQFESISNNVRYDAGTYTGDNGVIISIKDKTNYSWSDGSKEDIKLSFTILKGLIEKPTLNGTLTYTGKVQTYIPKKYDDYKEWISLTNNLATNVGSYNMEVSLKDPSNTIWSDGDTNASFTLTYKIEPKKYNIPTTKNVSYTGNEVTFYPTGMDYDAMTITGNTGTNEGTYKAIVSLIDKDNTCWSDGSTSDKEIEWSIVDTSSTYLVHEETSEETKTKTVKLTHKLTSKDLTITMPIASTYEINDETGALTISHNVTESLFTSNDKISISYSLVGEFDGCINLIETNTITSTNEYTVELNLEGVTISNSTACPLCLVCDDDIDVSAKKGTTNTINDNRSVASDTEVYNAAIYSSSDLKLKATGTLNVNSIAYGGIHCKDDLTIQKMTLSVNAYDNAIKGNDEVNIISGNITAISSYSNGIKTSNSSLSSKSKQKGTINIYGGTIDIYSALDGIEAAYDVNITDNPEVEASKQVDINLSITTCTYSSYTKRTYTKASNNIFNAPGGGGFGPGPEEGNQNKYEESTKGIKADDAVTIDKGTINIKSYDDSIHVNNDNALESEATPLGNVTINNGTLSLYSMDDGIHADNALVINNGTINISNSYEGLEGKSVAINGGTNSIKSSDDGINGTGTTGESIIISGGTNYIYAGGDGVDSNSNTTYDGILFSGGKTVIIQTSGGNSSIDTNQGYKYTTGAYVLALGLSSGMSQQESTKCSNFTSIGKATTLTGTTITASNYVTVKMPKSMSVYAIFLGSNSTTLSTSATYTSYDSNGVCWNV